jgi:Ring finger domain
LSDSLDQLNVFGISFFVFICIVCACCCIVQRRWYKIKQEREKQRQEIQKQVQLVLRNASEPALLSASSSSLPGMTTTTTTGSIAPTLSAMEKNSCTNKLTPDEFKRTLMHVQYNHESLNSISTSLDDAVGIETCTICLDDIQDGTCITGLPRCQHWFHEKCIRQWLLETKSDMCPNCTIPVKEKIVF